MNLAFLSSRYYLKFGLDRDPFPPKSTPKKLFLTQDLTGLLNQLTSAIKTQTETLLVESAAGAGKSVLAEYLGYVKEANWHLCHIRGNQTLGKLELAHAIISRHFPGHRFDKTRSDMILQAFLELYERNAKLPVVVIDDAHLLAQDTLKFLLQISSLCCNGVRYRFVLFADPSINRQLDLPSLKEIDAGHREYFKIPSFSKKQTAKYLEHRLALAGQYRLPPFDRDDIDYIFSNAAGVPGEIHQYARQVMQAKVIPGRTKRILFRSAASITAALVIFVVAYAGKSGNGMDASATGTPVSIALQLPDTQVHTPATDLRKVLTKQTQTIAAAGSMNEKNKAVPVKTQVAPHRSNKAVLLADMKRQADVQAGKIAQEKAKMEIRVQLAIYDGLALRVSDVVQH